MVASAVRRREPSTTAPGTDARVKGTAAIRRFACFAGRPPNHLYSVAAVRAAARRVLPRPVFDFADGGAEDERTLRRNEQAFEDVALLPRPLNGAAARDLSLSLFGAKLSMPLGIAPTGLAGLFWPDGECAAARAAAAAGTFYCASHGSACTLEDIAATGSSRAGCRFSSIPIAASPAKWWNAPRPQDTTRSC